MANDGVTTRLQKEMSQLQQELSQLRTDMDAKLDTRLKEFQERFKGDMRSELYSVLEQFLGQPQHESPSSTLQRKGKGILGESLPSFPPRDSLLLSPNENLDPVGHFARCSSLETRVQKFRYDCPRFNGTNFRGWWSKLEQFFEAEDIEDHTKVRLIMLHLEGKALDWHHLFAQRYGGLHQLTWELYARGIQARFSSNIYQDPIEELVSLKHQSTMDQFHDRFVSILNQIHLPERHALSIFISNLQPEVSQYLKLFKPQNLVDGYLVAKQVESILKGTSKKHTTWNEGFVYYVS